MSESADDPSERKIWDVRPPSSRPLKGRRQTADGYGSAWRGRAHARASRATRRSARARAYRDSNREPILANREPVAPPRMRG